MRQSTYRIIKSIGICLVLVLVGAFIYLFHKAIQITEPEQTYREESGENNAQLLTQYNPIGFRYENEEIV